jgi:glycosyltransferase involved in cell wall biosynthesis
MRVRTVMRVALIGTYPPVACGIATFTADVEGALADVGVDVTVIPVLESTDHRRLAIERHERASYVAAADAINRSGYDVVVIEHEFGIFGGEAGRYIVDLAEALRVPYALTLHTVLDTFPRHQGDVISRLCHRAAAVTVFTDSARRILLSQGLVDPAITRVIPHGAPIEMYADHDAADVRRRMGIGSDSPVLSTFGLLSPAKGIDLALTALVEVVAEHPLALYIIAGQTHPEVERRHGQEYRGRLVEQVDRLGLGGNVLFVNRFLTVHEVAELLSITAVFCTPYVGSDQTVSGALTFAVAAGCPIVSTPYQYAQDILADGGGVIVGFGDSHAFARAVITLLDETPARVHARPASRIVGRALAWPQVGRMIAELLAHVSTPGTSTVMPLTFPEVPTRMFDPVP